MTITIGKYTLTYDEKRKLSEVRIHGTPLIRAHLFNDLASEPCLDALTEEEIDVTIGMINSELRRSIQQSEALLRYVGA